MLRTECFFFVRHVFCTYLPEGGGRGRCHSLLNTTHRSANAKYEAKSEQSCGKTRARSTSGAPRAWRKRQNNTITFILTEEHFLHSLSGLFLTFFVQSFRASSTGLAKPLAWTRVIQMEAHEETVCRGVCREKVDGRTTFLASTCYSRRLSVGRRRPPLRCGATDVPRKRAVSEQLTLLVSS